MTLPTLYTARARERAASPALTRLARWADLAGRRLARLILDGRRYSPAAAWLTDLLERLGDARRRLEGWVRGGKDDLYR